jgi:magnesium-transporting ATPase (P-type)
MSDWYQQDSTHVLRQLDVNAASGLTEAEAARRLQKYGINELVGTGGFARQVIFQSKSEPDSRATKQSNVLA